MSKASARPPAHGVPQGSGKSLLGTVAIGDISHVFVNCLWCDQGMAHLLEIFDETSNTVPAATVLIDFGAEQMFKSRVLKAAQAAPAVNYVISQLEAMATPRIEFVIVSHQDTDHWSLLNYLVDAVEAKGMKLQVGKVCYGGSDWGEGAKAAVKRIGAYTAVPKTDVIPWTGFYSDYATADTAPKQLGNIGAVVFRTLVVNAPVKSTSLSLKKNGSSAVMVIEFGGWKFILPGDATWETLKSANGVLAAWTASPVQPCYVLSAPHHGSLATIVPDNKAAVIDFSLARRFIELTQPGTVIASAGSKNHFYHPYKQVLDILSTSTGDGGYGDHDIVAFDNSDATWSVFITSWNTYTTVLSKGAAPIRVANWYYGTDSTGHVVTRTFAFDTPTTATTDVPSKAMEVDDDAMALASRPVLAAQRWQGPSPVHRWSEVRLLADELAMIAPRRVIAPVPR